MTIGPRETHAGGGEAVDVRGLANLVAVAGQGRGGEVVGNDEKYVRFRGTERTAEDKEERRKNAWHGRGGMS